MRCQKSGQRWLTTAFCLFIYTRGSHHASHHDIAYSIYSHPVQQRSGSEPGTTRKESKEVRRKRTAGGKIMSTTMWPDTQWLIWPLRGVIKNAKMWVSENKIKHLCFKDNYIKVVSVVSDLSDKIFVQTKHLQHRHLNHCCCAEAMQQTGRQVHRLWAVSKFINCAKISACSFSMSPRL